MSRPKYDFERLRKRFPKMSIREIRREYVAVLAEMDYIEEHLDYDDYIEYAEPLGEAERYLAGYLARKSCYDAGVYLNCW